MNIRVLIILSFILFPAGLEAQSLKERIEAFKQRRQEKIAVTDRYQVSGPVLSYGSIQDQRISPLIYPGPGAGIYWESFRVSPGWTTITSLRLQYNHMNGPETLNEVFRNPQGRLETLLLYHTRNESWEAGGGLSAEYLMYLYTKLGNDSYHGDGIASFNAAGFYKKPFRLLKTDAWLRSGIIIPLFSYVNRIPEYNINGMEHILVGPDNYRRISLCTQIIKKLKHSDENRISISYKWDFGFLDDSGGQYPARIAYHRLSFGFWLKNL